MLTIDMLREIELCTRPRAQMAVGHFLRANYAFPPTRTSVVLDGLDRLPSCGRIYLAMNHTDRFNYFPFQLRLWRQRDEFTATWVKGKYYNRQIVRHFMLATNNIPAPSKGYVISADAAMVLGQPPADALYRAIRKELDAGAGQDSRLRDWAAANGYEEEVERLVLTPRRVLGHRYGPPFHYLQTLSHVFDQLMAGFVALNEQAFVRGIKIIVFPEGTRSRRLGTGHVGLAQMAVKTNATIIPVGYSGSDVAYPDDIPIARGGELVYRIGEPMTPEGDLSPFQIRDFFQPFTDSATPHYDVFSEMTELIMDRINALIDPLYQRDPGEANAATGSARFI
jgi:hypothetical protein